MEAAATVRPADDFEHRIEKFLVKADSKIDDGAEAVRDEFHGVGARMPRRLACFNQSASSCAKVASGARQRMTVTM